MAPLPHDDPQGMSGADSTAVRESMIRLEAKIDVVLGRHEGKIDDLLRRQGETGSTLREHDSRITANALTIAETRAQTASVAASQETLRSQFDKKSSSVVSWVAVGLSGLAVVLSPILNSLIQR